MQRRIVSREQWTYFIIYILNSLPPKTFSYTRKSLFKNLTSKLYYRKMELILPILKVSIRSGWRTESILKSPHSSSEDLK